MTLVLLIVSPFAAALVLALAGDRLGSRLAGALGTAALAFAFGIGIAVGQAFIAGKTFLVAEIGQWLPLRGADLALQVDATSTPMILTVTGAGALIALAAAGDRRTVAGIGRLFFAVEALVGGALLVIAARDLILLLAGWGTVGLTTALLLGHARQTAEGALSGARAFVFARASDVALLLGTLALLALFRTTDIGEISARMATITPTPSTDGALLAASVLVVTAVVVRAAQLPVHRWLVGEPRGPAAASAAVEAIATLCGAVLVIRLSAALHPVALSAAATLGALTAVAAMACALASATDRRKQSWITVAQLGAVIVVAAIGSTFAATLVAMVTVFTRAAAALTAERASGEPRPRALARAFAALASVAVMSGAALLLGEDRVAFALVLLTAAALAAVQAGWIIGRRRRDDSSHEAAVPEGRGPTDRWSVRIAPLAALVLGAVALIALVLGMAGGVSLGAPATGVTQGPLLAVAIVAVALGAGVSVSRARLPERAMRLLRTDRVSEALSDRGLVALVGIVAATLDRGAETSLERGGHAIGVVMERVSVGLRAVDKASVWRQEAIFVAAAIAIALYWTLR